MYLYKLYRCLLCFPEVSLIPETVVDMQVMSILAEIMEDDFLVLVFYEYIIHLKIVWILRVSNENIQKTMFQSHLIFRFSPA